MWERGVRLVSDLNSILEFDPYMYVFGASGWLLCGGASLCFCVCLDSLVNSFLRIVLLAVCDLAVVIIG